MTQHKGWLVVVLLLGSVSFAAADPQAPSVPPSAQPAPAERGVASPVQAPLPEVLQRADELFVAGKLKEAEAEFQRAAGLAGGPCGECILGLALVRGSERKWTVTVDMVQSALPLLTEPRTLARAYNQLGVAYVQGAGGSDRMSKAEDALRKATDYGGPWGEVARRNLAQVLFLEKRWADAVPVAREALDKAGNDTAAAQGARIVLCQARSHLRDKSSLVKVKGRPRKMEDGVTLGVKIAGPPPVYSEEARLAKVEGAVIVESIIDRDGCVRPMSVIKGLPKGLTEAALEVLPLWVFTPATFEGKPVRVLYTLTVKFKASERASRSPRPPTP
jgi:TonB family protein